jgi:hypothetical protein
MPRSVFSPQQWLNVGSIQWGRANKNARLQELHVFFNTCICMGMSVLLQACPVLANTGFMITVHYNTLVLFPLHSSFHSVFIGSVLHSTRNKQNCRGHADSFGPYNGVHSIDALLTHRCKMHCQCALSIHQHYKMSPEAKLPHYHSA